MAEASSALHALILLGNEDAIPDLIAVLMQKGNLELATAYLNCGNQKLYSAAETWATTRGYRLVLSDTGGPVGWGQL